MVVCVFAGKGEQWEYEALLDEEYLSPALKGERIHVLV